MQSSFNLKDRHHSPKGPHEFCRDVFRKSLALFITRRSLANLEETFIVSFFPSDCIKHPHHRSKTAEHHSRLCLSRSWLTRSMHTLTQYVILTQTTVRFLQYTVSTISVWSRHHELRVHIQVWNVSIFHRVRDRDEDSLLKKYHHFIPFYTRDTPKRLRQCVGPIWKIFRKISERKCRAQINPRSQESIVRRLTLHDIGCQHEDVILGPDEEFAVSAVAEDVDKRRVTVDLRIFLVGSSVRSGMILRGLHWVYYEDWSEVFCGKKNIFLSVSLRDESRWWNVKRSILSDRMSRYATLTSTSTWMYIFTLQHL